jgi:hypothetical protein
MAAIYSDWEARLINSWDDVNRYMQPFSDSEDGGEHGEGDELNDGTDTDEESKPWRDVDGAAEEDDCEGEALAAPQGDGAIVPAGSAAAEPLADDAGQRESKILADFDDLIARAAAVNDPLTMTCLTSRRDEMIRAWHRTDPVLMGELQRQRVEATEARERMRREFRTLDRQRKAEEADRRGEVADGQARPPLGISGARGEGAAGGQVGRVLREGCHAVP